MCSKSQCFYQKQNSDTATTLEYKHMYLIFSTGQQLFTIRTESQTGGSSTVAPQICMRLNVGVEGQFAQQPQNNGEVI